VTFEAFMHGVPVIGSDAGGIPEEIDEGSTGWLFRAGSVEDLARVLRERLADRADRTLAPDGFTTRLARLAPDQVAAEYEAVYAGAMSRKGMAERGLRSPDMLAGRI
jgi:glycosyltransferase involved in cell wall biosynthesis